MWAGLEEGKMTVSVLRPYRSLLKQVILGVETREVPLPSCFKTIPCIRAMGSISSHAWRMALPLVAGSPQDYAE